MAAPVPAHVEDIDAPYASAARIVLLICTLNSHSSKGNSSIGPLIQPRHIHPSVPPFILREGSFIQSEGSFTERAGVSFRDAHERMLTDSSGRRHVHGAASISLEFHLFVLRVPCL